MMENILNKVKYTVSKYHGNVQLWDACNGLSNCQSTGLDDAQSFKLACNVINLIHNLDPKTPLIFSVDIPAAENMRLNNRAINPLVFAESLIRAHDRSIAGIGLELNLNTWPNGTLPLDLPGLSDLIDHWSSQNRSLLVRLTTPLDLSPPSLQTLDYSKNQTSSIVSNWIYPVKLTATAFQDDDDDTAPEINPSQIATQPNSEKDCNATKPSLETDATERSGDPTTPSRKTKRRCNPLESMPGLLRVRHPKRRSVHQRSTTAIDCRVHDPTPLAIPALIPIKAGTIKQNHSQ
jgi:hypothetical protein